MISYSGQIPTLKGMSARMRKWYSQWLEVTKVTMTVKRVRIHRINTCGVETWPSLSHELVKIAWIFTGEPQESEDEQSNRGDEKYAGLYLYARFHSYYNSLLTDGSKLEELHFKILQHLQRFVDVFLSRNKCLWSIEILFCLTWALALLLCFLSDDVDEVEDEDAILFDAPCGKILSKKIFDW